MSGESYKRATWVSPDHAARALTALMTVGFTIVAAGLPEPGLFLIRGRPALFMVAALASLIHLIAWTQGTRIVWVTVAVAATLSRGLALIILDNGFAELRRASGVALWVMVAALIAYLGVVRVLAVEWERAHADQR